MNHMDFDLQKAKNGWLWGFAGNSETEGMAKEIFISLLERKDVKGCFDLPPNDSRSNRLLERGLVVQCGQSYQFTTKAIGLIYAQWAME